MSKRLIALIVGALAVGLIAGCGGSDSDGDSSTSSLTKAEFIKQADAICTTHHNQIEKKFGAFLAKYKEFKETEGAGSLTEAIETIVIPSFQTQDEELRALGTPSGEEDEVNAILTTFEKGINEGEKDPAGYAGRGPSSESTGGEITTADNMAAKYGLKVCITS